MCYARKEGRFATRSNLMVTKTYFETRWLVTEIVTRNMSDNACSH